MENVSEKYLKSIVLNLKAKSIGIIKECKNINIKRKILVRLLTLKHN